MLARVKAEEAQINRGKLKIFLGYAAGVGKTYAMLEAARLRKKEMDVVVGLVETHGRTETEALLEGFEIIPRKKIEYRGVQVEEMDLDAVLKRRPQLAVVDELAHTNNQGSRHVKRYQDVQELLEAGIDVFTTLNIQHVESLRNLVAQVTDVWMRETVPDSVIDSANEIELVDLPPDELIKRLKEGKVYVPELIAAATAEFFRKGNLTALRELSMRTAAARVDDQMRAYMESKAISGPWHTGERLVVLITPDFFSTNYIRSARRLAAQLDAEWFALYVETPNNIRLAPEKRNQVTEALKFAEKLGARTVTLRDESVANALADYARAHNVSKIVVGKPWRNRWIELLRPSGVDQVIHQNENFDVLVVRGRSEPSGRPKKIELPHLRLWRNYLAGLGFFLAATLLAEISHYFFNPTNLAMIYMLSIVVSAVYLGLGPSIMVSILGVLAFDFLFVSPTFIFSPRDLQYTFTLLALLGVGVVISYLASQSRQQTETAWEHERRAAAMYAFGRDLAVSNDLPSYLTAIVKRVKDTFGHEAVVFLPDPNNAEILKPYSENPKFKAGGNEIGAALWAYQHQKIIGYNTDTLPDSSSRYLPLVTARGVVGVLAVMELDSAHELTPQQEQLLVAYVDLAAVALEGILLARDNIIQTANNRVV